MADNIKVCSDCGENKPWSDYILMPSGKPRNKCKSCAVKISVERNHRITYGITLEQRDNLVKEQDYKCAICGKHEQDSVKQKLCVDHCHTSGKVRGMLCSNCNVMLGQAKDNIDILISAISYLQERG